MTDDVAVARVAPELTPYEVIEKVIASGDIGKMDAQARIAFYWRVCETVGLNPLTQPFAYMNLGGKIVLYARKDATDQLRKVNRVNVTELRRERDEALGTYTVYAHGRMPDGREDESSGVVNVKGMSGEVLANAMMKAETKAKRRLTLSLVGLGFLDESEVEGLGERLEVDSATGEITEHAKPVSLLDQVKQQAERLIKPADDPIADGIAILHRNDEPAEVAEEPPAILSEPMPEEVSATLPVEDPMADLVEVVEEDADIGNPPDEPTLQAPAGPGLTVAELADLARDRNIGKLRFASELECVPADVGKRIEAMTDEGRHALALRLGLVG